MPSALRVPNLLAPLGSSPASLLLNPPACNASLQPDGRAMPLPTLWDPSRAGNPHKHPVGESVRVVCRTRARNATLQLPSARCVQARLRAALPPSARPLATPPGPAHSALHYPGRPTAAPAAAALSAGPHRSPAGQVTAPDWDPTLRQRHPSSPAFAWAALRSCFFGKGGAENGTCGCCSPTALQGARQYHRRGWLCQN